jgi:hypothetical protein
MNGTLDDRRAASRTPVERLQGLKIAAIEGDGFRILPAKLADLSAGGFGVQMLAPLPAGSRVFVSCEYLCDDVYLDLRGWSKVAHCQDRGDGRFQIGIEFQGVKCHTLYDTEERRFGKYHWRGGLERAA